MGNYVPPYTEDDPFIDDEEFGIDAHDDKSDKYNMFPNGRPDKCYGLALSDSTNLGPYQAGVIQGLFRDLQAGGGQYEVVSGVAMGALNAHIVS